MLRRPFPERRSMRPSSSTCKKLVDPVDRRLSRNDPVGHIGQPDEGIDIVQLGGVDQRGQHRPGLGAALAAGEQMIPSVPEAMGRMLRSTVFESISRRPSSEKARQPCPMIERVAARFGECRLGRDLAQDRSFMSASSDARMDLVSVWRTARRSAALLTADPRLDGVGLGDLLDNGGREGRTGRFVDRHEPSPCMGEAKGQHRFACSTGVSFVGGIAIHLQDALERRRAGRRSRGPIDWLRRHR